MESKHDLELTIRTATLIKSLSQLVGIRDPMIARLMIAESVEQFQALAKFVDSVQPKRAARTSNPPHAGD